VLAALTALPPTSTINPTPTSYEPSDSSPTLRVNMSQSNSQSSVGESLQPVRFTKRTRSDKPFRFTDRRTPAVKVIRKSRANSPVSTRRDDHLSKSELQPSRTPGQHYRGERHTSKAFNASAPEFQSQSKQPPQARHTYSRSVRARPSGTDQMNARTSQRPKPVTQPPPLRSLLLEPSPPPLESQSSS
jgi:hypothetical protein